MCENEQKPELEPKPGVMKNESFEAGATLMKTNSSWAGTGAMFMQRRAADPVLCHLYDSSTALDKNALWDM